MPTHLLRQFCQCKQQQFYAHINSPNNILNFFHVSLHKVFRTTPAVVSCLNDRLFDGQKGLLKFSLVSTWCFYFALLSLNCRWNLQKSLWQINFKVQNHSDVWNFTLNWQRMKKFFSYDFSFGKSWLVRQS